MTPEELLAAARAETGLHDVGEPGFLEPLRVLLDSVHTEGALVEAGLAGIHQDVVRHLVNRLRLVHDLNAHPEIAEEQVDDPIVIVGLPRTGTTKLQRMIAQDPAVQHLPLWKALFPAPLPADTGPGAADPRLAIAAGFVAQITEQAPDFAAAHPMGVEEADEEMFIQLGAFDGPAAWGNFYHAPSYVRWLRDRSASASYDYLATMLRYLQWQGGGRRDRPWVLKTPLHLAHLDALTAAFPRAVVVHCHRALEVCVPSLCRLIEVARISRGCQDIDPVRVGAEMLHLWAGEWQANLSQRASVPDTATVLDVRFSDIAAEPLTVIREIYAHRSLDLAAETVDRMRRWEDNHRVEAGRHSYTLQRYQLTTSDIDEAFASYLDKIGAGA